MVDRMGEAASVALLRHVALVTARYFTSFLRMKTAAQTCAFENL